MHLQIMNEVESIPTSPIPFSIQSHDFLSAEKKVISSSNSETSPCLTDEYLQPTV